MAITQTDSGAFVISSSRVWLPGVYADRRAANYAFRFPDAVLLALQNAKNDGDQSLITFADLQAARKRIGPKGQRP